MRPDLFDALRRGRPRPAEEWSGEQWATTDRAEVLVDLHWERERGDHLAYAVGLLVDPLDCFEPARLTVSPEDAERLAAELLEGAARARAAQAREDAR